MDNEKKNQSCVTNANKKIEPRTVRLSDVAKKAIESSSGLSAINSQINAFKDLASSPAMKESMGATLSLMKDLDSQTGQLKQMFSIQNQFAEAMKPAMSEQLKGIARFADQFHKVEVPTIASFPTSARQVSEMSETLHRLHRAEAEEKALRRRGVEAQIESAKLLADQREEIEVMREAINALLKHNIEQSKQQAIAFQERDKVEGQRFSENTRLSKIAAWAGVLSVILAAIAIGVQLFYGK